MYCTSGYNVVAKRNFLRIFEFSKVPISLSNNVMKERLYCKLMLLQTHVMGMKSFKRDWDRHNARETIKVTLERRIYNLGNWIRFHLHSYLPVVYKIYFRTKKYFHRHQEVRGCIAIVMSQVFGFFKYPYRVTDCWLDILHG